ncbi:MAG: hypothetical protein JWN52_1457 [Actinomycetia bacterium]|nr:hypothetical protein [Actinomycetes bacterium]
MRTVFLSMTTTIDGFVAGPDNQLDWMVQTPDQELNDDVVALFSRADSGFLGYPVATWAQRRLGINRASADSHIRSAGSYRTRLT